MSGLPDNLYPEFLVTLLISLTVLLFQIRTHSEKIQELDNVNLNISYLITNNAQKTHIDEIHGKVSGLSDVIKISEQFPSLYTAFLKNRERVHSIRYLNELTKELVNSSSLLIDKIASHPEGTDIIVNNEYQRILYLRNMFKIKSTKKIIALTYDYADYFNSFWSGLQLDQFVEVNLEAARHATIERYFVFSRNRDIKDKTKKELLINIFRDFDKVERIKTYLIWQEDLISLFPDFWKRSFLLIDDYITSEVKYEIDNESKLPGYISFGNNETINKLKTKIERLESIRKEELTLNEINTIWNTGN